MSARRLIGLLVIVTSLVGILLVGRLFHNLDIIVIAVIAGSVGTFLIVRPTRRP